jgi:iron complex outermembrane receptor protein
MTPLLRYCPVTDSSALRERRRFSLYPTGWPWVAMGGLMLLCHGQTRAQSPDNGNGIGNGNGTPAARIEEVQVTGSRLPATNLQSISPVTSVSAEEIHQIGAIDVEAALRDLPEAFPGRGETTNNNGSGDTSANLRNLGEQRTLVLIDGKRAVGSDSRGVVDLDAIPVGMLERVDIMTGGASAVYGADAIAGVVNLILKKNFTGVEATAQYGSYSQSDGRKYDTSLLGGFNFGAGGNVTAFVGFTKRDPVYARDRAWGYPIVNSNGTTLEPYGLSIGSIGQNLDSGTMFSPDRTLVPASGANPLNYTQWTSTQFLVVPQERYSAGLNAHYDANPAVQPYFRATWSQNKVDRQVLNGAPFAAPVTVNYGNPLLSQQERDSLFTAGAHADGDTTSFTLGRMLTENGNVGEQDTYDTYELVGGITGALSSHFNYDVSAQYGSTQWKQALVGDIAPAAFQQGLLVNPDGTCINPANHCVPIDIFTSAAGTITRAQVDSINLTQRADSNTAQWVTTAAVTGDLGQFGLQSPWANDAVGVVLGAEHRNESSDYRPDANLAVGNNIVFGSIPALSGAYHVTEGFLETRVPLATDRPWAQSLLLEGGYRYSNYNRAGTTNTFKYGLVWQPVNDIRVRGAFERAVRAPNINELYTPQQPETTNGIDPCFSSNGAGPKASKDLCVATGVPASAYGSANLQCLNALCVVYQGGNPALSVETSLSKTFGLSITPRFAPGLTVSTDYYDIRIEGAIATLASDAQPVLDGCYGTGFGQNPPQSASNIYCQALQRSPSGALFGGGHNGALGGIVLLNSNVGSLSVSGLDTDISYQSRLADIGLDAIPGAVAISTKAAYVRSYRTQANAELPVYQCAGSFGSTCGQPIPEWRVSTRLTYSPLDSLSLSVRWRYITSLVLDADKFSGTVTDPPDHAIPSFSYFDLSGSWRVTDQVSLHGGVTNVLNKYPPVLSLSVAGAFISGFSNTFPATYDIGRQLFLGVSARF